MKPSTYNFIGHAYGLNGALSLATVGYVYLRTDVISAWWLFITAISFAGAMINWSIAKNAASE